MYSDGISAGAVAMLVAGLTFCVVGVWAVVGFGPAVVLLGLILVFLGWCAI